MTDEIRKLPNQPLTCVLAEFRYSQILKIADHIPDIQESIRKTYPVLNRADQQTVQLAGQEINIISASQWVFTSQDLRSAVIIGTDKLIFVTSTYDRFPEFSDRCLSVLSKLQEIVDPSLLLRIGLRYNDYISIEDTSAAAEIVGPQFLPRGELTNLGSSTIHHRTETAIATSEGTLLVRSLLGMHGLAVMSDLGQALPVKLDVKGDMNVLALLLDFDHSWTADQPGETFDLEVAKAHLDSLHETAREAFWRATTEYARREIWT